MEHKKGFIIVTYTRVNIGKGWQAWYEYRWFKKYYTSRAIAEDAIKQCIYLRNTETHEYQHDIQEFDYIINIPTNDIHTARPKG